MAPAAGLAAPVYCHPLERTAAESQSSYRDYWDLGLLHGWARPVVTRLLRIWDGGALSIAGTVQEGDELGGFSVIHLPGHAPGQIGLYRAQDGLALGLRLRADGRRRDGVCVGRRRSRIRRSTSIPRRRASQSAGWRRCR